ncbi:uncharacterized protein LOC119140050 [Falco rusticolus]|uniref:uncharacterized protein LOC119140050 n=1 Tax=Falco rusticolus TaxID=120794 RepID=UPI0018869024|nr:uncharacterized protein LOC119140050 [Falco rusticolus]
MFPSDPNYSVILCSFPPTQNFTWVCLVKALSDFSLLSRMFVGNCPVSSSHQWVASHLLHYLKLPCSHWLREGCGVTKQGSTLSRRGCGRTWLQVSCERATRCLGRPGLLHKHQLPGPLQGHFCQSWHCWGTSSQFWSFQATGPSFTPWNQAPTPSKSAPVWAKFGWGRSHRDLWQRRCIRHSLERQMPQFYHEAVRKERRSHPFAAHLAGAVSQGPRSAPSLPLGKAQSATGAKAAAVLQGSPAGDFCLQSQAPVRPNLLQPQSFFVPNQTQDTGKWGLGPPEITPLITPPEARKGFPCRP